MTWWFRDAKKGDAAYEDRLAYNRLLYRRNKRNRQIKARTRYAEDSEFREKAKKNAAQYREKNPGYDIESKREWKKRNPAKVKAGLLQRRGRAKEQTPKWADPQNMNMYYTMAKFLSNLGFEQYHVDHIVPLQGKKVSGLHCEDNLQVITARKNLAKHNKFI